MLFFISQDGLKAIDSNKIDFFYIPTWKNSRDKYQLMAKSPKMPADEGGYDFLIMFEHEDIKVTKEVLRFLLAFQIAMSDDFILHVDLTALYNCGLKISSELFTAENPATSKVTVPLELDTTPLDEAQKKADNLKATLAEVLTAIRQTNGISEH